MTDNGITSDFIKSFLSETEKKWANCKINYNIWGYQFQAGTKWNPGLLQKEIDEYQSALDIPFPSDFIRFLKYANGTDLQTINVYGNSNDPPKYSMGVYCYPRDLDIIRQRIEWLKEDWDAALESLELGQEILGKNPQFIPFFSHRYLLSNGNPNNSIVCSIYGSDAIVYGSNFREYLQNEFLPTSY